jgi:hypothetical protein
MVPIADPERARRTTLRSQIRNSRKHHALDRRSGTRA